MHSVKFAAALITFAASAAFAQDPAAAPNPATPPPAATEAPSAETAIVPARVEGVATVGDLARVQSQVLIAEAQKKLAEARKGMGEAGVEEVADALDGGSVSPSARSRRPYATPVVEGIHGSATNPYAVIRVSDATVLSVRAGDTLPGGVRVERVTNTGVQVRTQQGSRVLGFSSAAPSLNEGAAAPAAPANR